VDSYDEQDKCLIVYKLVENFSHLTQNLLLLSMVIELKFLPFEMASN
jgi:hypothetical protein